MNDAVTFERVFTGEAAMREGFLAAYVFAKTLMANGDRVHIKVMTALDPIRAKQRKFLKDIVFGQIAEQVYLGPNRERYTKAAWAEAYRERFLGSRFETKKLPGWEEERTVEVKNSTEELGVKRYSEYTDLCIDTAIIEHGVEFVFEPAEREEVRYVTRPRKERQQ